MMAKCHGCEEDGIVVAESWHDHDKGGKVAHFWTEGCHDCDTHLSLP